MGFKIRLGAQKPEPERVSPHGIQQTSIEPTPTKQKIYVNHPHEVTLRTRDEVAAGVPRSGEKTRIFQELRDETQVPLDNLGFWIRNLKDDQFFYYTLELFKEKGTAYCVNRIKSLDKSFHKSHLANIQILLSCAYYMLGIQRRPSQLQNSNAEIVYVGRVTQISEKEVKNTKIQSAWFLSWEILGTIANTKLLSNTRDQITRRMI